MSGGCARCGRWTGLRPRGKRNLCETHFYRAALANGFLLLALDVAISAMAAGLTGVPVAAAVAAGLVALLAELSAGGVLRVAIARLTGLRVTRVVLGVGPRLASRRAGGTRYDLRAVPVSAEVFVGPRGNPRAYRWRLAWLALCACGPVTYAGFFVLASLLPPLPAVAAGSAAAYALYWDVMGLVLGHHRRARGKPWRGDLYYLLRRPLRPMPVPFDTPAGWSVSSAEYFDDVQAVTDVIPTGRVTPAAAALERLRALHPGEPGWDIRYGSLLVEQRRRAEARTVFATLRAAHPQRYGADCALALAWIGAMDGDDPAVTAALLDATEGTHHDRTEVAATRALAAARAGRLDEALALCDEAAGGKPYTAALVEAVRAYVARCRGDAAVERAHADAARALYPDCLELDLLV
jgi:hypothetical protein